MFKYPGKWSVHDSKLFYCTHPPRGRVFCGEFGRAGDSQSGGEAAPAAGNVEVGGWEVEGRLLAGDKATLDGSEVKVT